MLGSTFAYLTLLPGPRFLCIRTLCRLRQRHCNVTTNRRAAVTRLRKRHTAGFSYSGHGNNDPQPLWG